jgi:Co/Zn/Cd efflux system component
VSGVEEVADLHVWQLTHEKFCMTAHLVLKETHYSRQQEVLRKADTLIRRQFKINHNTIQIIAQEPAEQQITPEKEEKYDFWNDLHA